MDISKIKSIFAGAVALAGLATAAGPTVTVGEVTAGEPWGKVTVNYTLGGTDAKTDYKVAFDVTAGGRTASVTNDAATLEDKAYAQEIDTAALFGGSVADTKAKVKVTLIALKPKQDVTHPTESSLYLVIDLSGGAGAASYPVSYLSDVPSGGWTDEHKTEKLVLRRIANGTFTMGSPSGEVGRYNDETRHEVTISRPFYMGVFEVTQRQWELVMGTRPSWFSNSSCYATRPVEKVSYNDIRGSSEGAKWPSANTVDSTSFMGRIRARTGLTFDLPTEAQWEYACRAGTGTALNSGKDLTSTGRDPAMDEVGRYEYNFPSGGTDFSSSSGLTAGTAAVGSYAPNAWGLYDMHGNVREWCADRYGMYGGDATDPAGAASGSYRVMRGGSWFNYAQSCRSAYRGIISPSYANNNYYGFRLCCAVGLQ